MLITHEREKLLNAIVFFARKVKFLGKVKLFKLLYFLDFGHFRETGRSVTGLDYHAWKMGPVPTALFDEVESPEPDLCEKISFQEVATRGRPMLTVSARAEFDPSHFTRREIRLMETLATQYLDARADDMIEATHLATLPWHKVYVEEGLAQGGIPYEYALLEQERAMLLPIVAEREALLRHFSKAGKRGVSCTA